jgi:hypothetical protein
MCEANVHTINVSIILHISTDDSFCASTWLGHNSNSGALLHFYYNVQYLQLKHLLQKIFLKVISINKIYLKYMEAFMLVVHNIQLGLKLHLVNKFTKDHKTSLNILIETRVNTSAQTNGWIKYYSELHQ